MLLEEIEIFKAIAETKSFSQAAERLHMSRPGLSNKISNIESNYGVKLYERTSQGVVPTQAGLIVTRFADRIKGLENDLQAEISALDEHFDQTITIGASYADGVELLPKIIKKYMTTHPDTRVHLDVGYEPELLRKMYDFQIDFSILENVMISKGFALETLGYKELVCLAPDMAPYNMFPQPVKVETFLELPMIIYEWDSGRHMVGDRYYREKHGVSLKDYNMVARFDTHEAMINGVIAGIGWAMFPEAIARRYRNTPGIIKLKKGIGPVLYPVSLVRHEKRALSDEALDFMDFLKGALPEHYFRKHSDVQPY